MGVYENILNQFKQCYLNCFLPSDEFLIESFKKYLGYDCTIMVRDDNEIIVNVSIPKGYISLKFSFRKSSNDRLCVNDITIDNVSD